MEQELTVYSWLCSDSILADAQGPYGVSGIKPELVTCEANALPTLEYMKPVRQDEFQINLYSIFPLLQLSFSPPSWPVVKSK